MGLYDSILNNLTTAMKAKDAGRVQALRLLKASLLTVMKETGASTLTDEQTIAVLQREAKKRRESEEAFTAGGRPELAAQEAAERAIIDEYLPAQLTNEEIQAVVNAVVQEKGKSNFGTVMGMAMQQLKGRADGGRVKAAVEATLKEAALKHNT